MAAKRKGAGEERYEVIERVIGMLAEHFDAGAGMVCWEESGETRYFTLRFGNSFAVEAMSDQMRSCMEEEKESEEEEEAD